MGKIQRQYMAKRTTSKSALKNCRKLRWNSKTWPKMYRVKRRFLNWRGNGWSVCKRDECWNQERTKLKEKRWGMWWNVMWRRTPRSRGGRSSEDLWRWLKMDRMHISDGAWGRECGGGMGVLIGHFVL